MFLTGARERILARLSLYAVVLLLLFLIGPSLSPAASPEIIESITAKLEKWDTEKAWKQVQQQLAGEPEDAKLLGLAGRVAFDRGDYAAALKLLNAAVAKGAADDHLKGMVQLTESTIKVLAPFRSYESPHFHIFLDEKQDGVLVDYLINALEKTRQAMAKRFGFRPDGKVRVEIFPDAQAFYDATVLSARDIEVAGAVGLAKFNKLQLLSPRALTYGYRWLDAVSHEYMHYLIVKLSGNKAPIWFHEGLAKFEETRWREGPSYLSPMYQTLLARALAKSRLIPFERMEPSLVRLETPEDVQLAYAQAASAIEFIIQEGGPGAVGRVMQSMAAGSSEGAGAALQEVMSLPLPDFETKWKAHLAAQGLKEAPGTSLRRYKVREGKADEERMDMEEIKSLQARNRAHLGDRFKERGRLKAAAQEYRRALVEAPHSVSILNRLSSVLLHLEQNDEALVLLNRAKEISPDHPTTYTDLGRVYLRLGKWKEAREAFESSTQINPFNPEAHRGLVEACEKLGDRAAAAKEREIARRLNP